MKLERRIALTEAVRHYDRCVEAKLDADTINDAGSWVIDMAREAVSATAMHNAADDYCPAAEYMRNLRESAQLTQTQLALRLGVSRRVIQYYESEEDKREPPFSYQIALETLVKI